MKKIFLFQRGLLSGGNLVDPQINFNYPEKYSIHSFGVYVPYSEQKGFIHGQLTEFGNVNNVITITPRFFVGGGVLDATPNDTERFRKSEYLYLHQSVEAQSTIKVLPDSNPIIWTSPTLTSVEQLVPVFIEIPRIKGLGMFLEFGATGTTPQFCGTLWFDKTI